MCSKKTAGTLLVGSSNPRVFSSSQIDRTRRGWLINSACFVNKPKIITGVILDLGGTFKNVIELLTPRRKEYDKTVYLNVAVGPGQEI